MQLVLPFEAGILISLPECCDKILSLALIRIWLSVINILHRSTASSLKKHTGWTVSFGFPPALLLECFCAVFFIICQMTTCLLQANEKNPFVTHQKHISLLCSASLPSVLIWMTNSFEETKSVSLAQPLKSRAQHKSVWTSPGTTVAQVAQRVVISFTFPRYCRWLLLCSNNILFHWDSGLYSNSPILPRWDKSEEWNRCWTTNSINVWGCEFLDVVLKLGLSCPWAGLVIGHFSWGWQHESPIVILVFFLFVCTELLWSGCQAEWNSSIELCTWRNSCPNWDVERCTVRQ